MSKTIVGAVIGYGGMGNFHAEKMQTVHGIKLAGVYDTDPRQNDLARSRGIKAYASREELLADPQIDLVTIATPNDVHKEIALAALKAGKNVICEKPVAMNSAELDEMIAASEKYGKLMMNESSLRRLNNDETEADRLSGIYERAVYARGALASFGTDPLDADRPAHPSAARSAPGPAGGNR